jgi:hypothetical protein
MDCHLRATMNGKWRNSTEIDYLSIRFARPAITSFAAQLVKQKIIKEATKTVQSDGGLHTFTSREKAMISRYDLGADSFPEASKIFQKSMPLAWRLLLALSAPNEDAVARERRPPVDGKSSVQYHDQT